MTAFVLACGAQVLPGGQHHLPLTTENLNTEFLGRVAHARNGRISGQNDGVGECRHLLFGLADLDPDEC